MSRIKPIARLKSSLQKPAITVYILDDIKKSSILKNGIGIEGQKNTQTSKKYVCRQIKMQVLLENKSICYPYSDYTITLA